MTLQYSYDDAHCLTCVTDGAGNTGNKTGETLKGAGGILVRNIARVFDALGRVLQVTVAAQ